MDRVDIMVDIETLGVGSDAFTFQIAACAFDIATGEIINTFNESLDIEQLNDITVKGATLLWWLKTNKELLYKLLSQGTIPSEEKLFGKMVEWVNQLPGGLTAKFLWGNGILFDNNIIRTHCERYHLTYPIYYRNDRDMRTLLELASIKTGLPELEIKKQFGANDVVAHDAFDDVRNQISIVSACYKLLID